MIKPLTVNDIPHIVLLHKTCFPQDTLTLLGQKFLQLMYTGLLNLSDVHAFGATKKGELVGFVIGVGDSKTAMRRIISSRAFAFIAALLPIVVNPPLLKRILETFFYGQKSATTPAELLVIGVALSFRHRGTGRKLFTAFTKSLQKKKIFHFHVSVYSDNWIANRFYKNLGGRKTHVFNLYNKKWQVYKHTTLPIHHPTHISVILPTYNETGNIVPLINRVLDVCADNHLIPEILVVDDASPDGTAEKVRFEFRRNRHVRVIVRKKDRGLAASIADGIRAARFTTVVVMDTDFNHDPRVIPDLVSSLSHADLVIGSRFVKTGGMEDRYRHYLSYLFNLFIRLYLGLPTRDNLSGFFATRKTHLKMHLSPWVFSGFGEYFVRLLYLLHKENKTFKEIPVYYILRHHGERKSQFLPMLISYSRAVINLKNKLTTS